MKVKILIVGMILLAACLSGCINKNDDMHGTYRCVADDDSGILLLSSDGNYRLLIDEKYGGGGIFGNFTVIDDRVIGKNVLLERKLLDDLLKFTIDGRDLIDRDDDRWVRD